MIQYTAYLFSIIFNYSFMAGFDNCFVGCLFLVTNIELFVHFWSKTRPQKVQLFVETGLKTEGMQAAAYAACIVSLIKNLEELQVSLADVEELVKLIKNISRAIPKHLGPTTKQRPADFKSLSLDKLNKLSKKVDHETFGTLGNAFAILFVEVFEVGTLDVRDLGEHRNYTRMYCRSKTCERLRSHGLGSRGGSEKSSGSRGTEAERKSSEGRTGEVETTAHDASARDQRGQKKGRGE